MENLEIIKQIGIGILSFFKKELIGYIYKIYNQTKERYNIYKNAKNIINNYNKQKEIIKQYETDINCYNIKYKQNKLEILIQKIKDQYGEDNFGNWWFDDNMELKSIVRHNEKTMQLPYIEYYEHIWKDMGELKIYKI